MPSLVADNIFLPNMHHYPFHIKDYAAATAHLSNEEDLAYRRLLDMYYDTEAPIPLEIEPVSRRLRVDKRALSECLAEFFIHTENGWIHARCDDEISRYHAKIEQARQAGKLGGRRKKTERKADGKRTLSGSLANQEPITINQVNVHSRFSDFWIAYPIKKGKAVAEKAWRKAKVDNDFDSVLEALKAQVASCKDLTYFPHASTWLNGRRWEDEPEADKDRAAMFAGGW